MRNKNQSELIHALQNKTVESQRPNMLSACTPSYYYHHLQVQQCWMTSVFGINIEVASESMWFGFFVASRHMRIVLTLFIRPLIHNLNMYMLASYI